MSGKNRVLLTVEPLNARLKGLTTALLTSFSEAARVCLTRHHTSPVLMMIDSKGLRADAVTQWLEPDIVTRRAWANELDTTEYGAYGIALAAVQITEEIALVGRAQNGTGADFYVAPAGASAEDLEDWFRLEVSGIDKGGERLVYRRLAKKLRQALRGASNVPALAAVVGFQARLIAIQEAKVT